MSRPRIRRRVCCLPERNLFGPLHGPIENRETILMSVDEYETLRLIDFEGMTQEECAQRMKVARTTVQRIYWDARKKVAQTLVNGGLLKIEGGDYKLYNENEKAFGCRRCRRRHRGGNTL